MRGLTFSNPSHVCEEFQERKLHTLQTCKAAEKHVGEREKLADASVTLRWVMT